MVRINRLRRAAVSVGVGLSWCMANAAGGQTAPARAEVGDASHNIPLSASTDVANKNVTVDAALLPYSVSRRIFGTEIAKHYAIIQLVISNHDAGDAMIVQSVILDYRHWLFSGSFAALGAMPGVASNLTPQQTSNTPFQVASAESRLVRAELQDAQQWTARNWTVRSAVLIGATAVAYQFPFGEGFAKGSNAFSGVMIPGLQAMWPDNVQAQINHISDFGFGTNHVIPKNSSDVVVAFFPLDRFLTPDLQEIFLKAPSAYFNPSEMLIDKTYRVRLLNLLRRAGALTTDITEEKKRKRRQKDESSDRFDSKVVTNAILHYESFKLKYNAPVMPGTAENRNAAAQRRVDALSSACNAPPDRLPQASKSDPSQDVLPQNFNQQDCLLLTLLNGVSLNNIRVVASGIMAVDTSKIPATLTAVQFKSDATKPETWAVNAKAQTATLVGTFLSGAQPVITATDEAGKTIAGPVLDALMVDALNSDDNKLVFTYTVPTKIATGTVLSFTVVKKSKDGSQAQSAALTYSVKYTETAAAGDDKGSGDSQHGAAVAPPAPPAAGTKAETPVARAAKIKARNKKDIAPKPNQ